MSREAQRQGFAQHPGVIVNISSVGGLRTEYGLGVYNLTKAAMMYMTRQLASELGPTRVVCVAPGLIETDFSQVLIESFGEKLKRTLPLRRLGMPGDVANMVVFLESDRASYVTGETFVIDGGFATLGVGD